MNAWLAVLDPADMEGSVSAKFHLRPFQLANFLGSQAVAVCCNDQAGVSMAIEAILGGLDQLLDLCRCQIFTGA